MDEIQAIQQIIDERTHLDECQFVKYNHTKECDCLYGVILMAKRTLDEANELLEKRKQHQLAQVKEIARLKAQLDEANEERKQWSNNYWTLHDKYYKRKEENAQLKARVEESENLIEASNRFNDYMRQELDRIVRVILPADEDVTDEIQKIIGLLEPKN